MRGLTYTEIISFKLIPLGPPGPRYLVHEGLPDHSPSEGNEGHVSLNDLPKYTIDPRVRPYIHIAGVVMESSKAEATFEVNVEQYVSCAKSDPSTKQAGGNRSKPTTRFFCHIPDSPKYKSWGSKPMPGNKRWISIQGFLTGVDRSSDDSEVEQFRIDVDNVIFCGHYTPPVNSAAFVPQSCECVDSFVILASNSRCVAPGKSTALFSYGQLHKSPQSRKPLNQDGA